LNRERMSGRPLLMRVSSSRQHELARIYTHLRTAVSLRRKAGRVLQESAGLSIHRHHHDSTAESALSGALVASTTCWLACERTSPGGGPLIGELKAGKSEARSHGSTTFAE